MAGVTFGIHFYVFSLELGTRFAFVSYEYQISPLLTFICTFCSWQENNLHKKFAYFRDLYLLWFPLRWKTAFVRGKYWGYGNQGKWYQFRSAEAKKWQQFKCKMYFNNNLCYFCPFRCFISLRNLYARLFSFFCHIFIAWPTKHFSNNFDMIS